MESSNFTGPDQWQVRSELTANPLYISKKQIIAYQLS